MCYMKCCHGQVQEDMLMCDIYTLFISHDVNAHCLETLVFEPNKK